MRTGYTGETGAELLVADEDARTLWSALLAAGADGTVAPCGLGARDTLRLEAALLLYGQDITKNTTPFEARLGWLTQLDRPRQPEFVGREALLEAAERGPETLLVGLATDAHTIPRHGDEITVGDVWWARSPPAPTARCSATPSRWATCCPSTPPSAPRSSSQRREGGARPRRRAAVLPRGRHAHPGAAGDRRDSASPGVAAIGRRPRTPRELPVPHRRRPPDHAGRGRRRLHRRSLLPHPRRAAQLHPATSPRVSPNPKWRHACRTSPPTTRCAARPPSWGPAASTTTCPRPCGR